MKGPLGLIVAALLGLFGVALNWFYLQGKTRDIESVSFLGVKSGVVIEPGEAFRKEHFKEVKIPSLNKGDLEDFVYLYDDVNTVAGIRATRDYQGGELVYREDYRTPPQQLELKENERLIWIPVESRSFVPDLVNPGDKITFILPRSALRMPTPADPNLGGESPASSRTQMIGPFTIRSLGNRLGSRDVMKASRLSQVQERQVGIVVVVEEVDGEERLQPKAAQLLERLQQSNYRNVGVALHPRSKD